jgi:transposase
VPISALDHPLEHLLRSTVVSDIMGVSSRDMMDAMIEGEEDPEKLAAFARRTLKKKKEELELALR